MLLSRFVYNRKRQRDRDRGRQIVRRLINFSCCYLFCFYGIILLYFLPLVSNDIFALSSISPNSFSKILHSKSVHSVFFLFCFFFFFYYFYCCCCCFFFIFFFFSFKIYLDNDVTGALEAAADNLSCMYTSTNSFDILNKVWENQLSQPGEYRLLLLSI